METCHEFMVVPSQSACMRAKLKLLQSFNVTSNRNNQMALRCRCARATPPASLEVVGMRTNTNWKPLSRTPSMPVTCVFDARPSAVQTFSFVHAPKCQRVKQRSSATSAMVRRTTRARHMPGECKGAPSRLHHSSGQCLSYFLNMQMRPSIYLLYHAQMPMSYATRCSTCIFPSRHAGRPTSVCNNKPREPTICKTVHIICSCHISPNAVAPTTFKHRSCRPTGHE